MAEAVVSFTVERLEDLLKSEAKFLSGVKDKVVEIKNQLKEMQNFLKDADKKRGNPGVGKWVAEIRELSLQTEDVLETYAVKVASRRERGNMKKIMGRFASFIGEQSITLDKIGSEIKTIQAKIKDLATSRPILGIQALHDHQVERSDAQQRSSYAHLFEKDFVGMEEEIEELVSFLKKEDRGYEVISVWGMGGQGKTALVQKLYHHPDVRSHFQAFAWVNITQELDRQKVLQDILQELDPTSSEIKGIGVAELVQQLYRTQKELKCLVVIDDIWSSIHWTMLKDAFSVDSSKILLTTRNEEVANIGFPYKLRSLSEEESWKLLLKVLKEITVEPEKAEVARGIVRQCQGLPLAISVLGGILKNKSSLVEWKMVKKDISLNLSRGEYGALKHILDLSYDDLPFHLKQLFLYLGTFKEDEEIESGNLYLLWIAEGMIPSVQKEVGEMLMHVAERYLVELAQRNLIQLEQMDEPGRKWLQVRSCRLHDLIRDLCLSKGKDEDFIKKIDFRVTHNESYHWVIGMETRRLAFYMYDYEDNIALETLLMEQQYMVGQLRSLLFFNECSLGNKINNLKDFKLVRVLKLDRFKFTTGELSGIVELIHLRYLSLKDCELEELPSCIEHLRYLETLDIRVNSGIIIPDVLWKMKHLKHLYLPLNNWNVNKKLRFDGLKELELLWNFDASKCDRNDLMKLTNLQVLEAKACTLSEQEGVMNFDNLQHLRYSRTDP